LSIFFYGFWQKILRSLSGDKRVGNKKREAFIATLTNILKSLAEFYDLDNYLFSIKPIQPKGSVKAIIVSFKS
jgi:hypothetical protein